MKHITSILSCLFLIFSFTASTQTSVLSTQSVSIDPDRYKDVKGTPYLFDDWVDADIIDAEGNKISDIAVNYNGFEHGLEVMKNDRITVLDETFYPKIIIADHGMKKNVDGSLYLVPYKQSASTKGMYIQEIYSSEELGLYKKFRVAKKETESNTPGKILVLRRFSKYTDYILRQGTEYIPIKKKVDEISKHVGHEKTIKSFCKKNKIKLKSDQEALELMEYIQTLL